MSLTKRINGDYTIQSVGSTDRVYVNTHTVTINGNLNVLGNTTSINTTNTDIYDNIIALNSGTSGAPTLNAGIMIVRGTSPNVDLRWNETVDSWQITNDGSTYANIATSSTSGGLTLTGNLDMQSYTLYSSTGSYVKFADNVAIQTTAVTVPALAGNTVVYAKAPNSGGAGLYVSNTNGTDQELVTKAKAIVFALIM